MTRSGHGLSSLRPTPQLKRVRRAIRHATARARAVIAWERLWPLLVPLVSLVLLYCAVSFAGIWAMLPDWGRIAGLCLFGIAGLACLWQLRNVRLPDEEEAERRVEQVSGLEHRPLVALGDELAGSDADMATRKLWGMHLERAAQRIESLKVGAPNPPVSVRDPYALRVVAVLLFVAGFFYAGPERGERLTAAFSAAPATAIETPLRIDAWLSPPAYTARPPLLLLSGAIDSDPRLEAIEAPEGSVVMVKAPQGAALSVSILNTGSEPEPVTAQPPLQEGGLEEFAVTLETSATVAVERDGVAIHRWQFDVIDDLAPRIKLVEDPKQAASRAVRLTYELEDDYGVVSAEAHFTPVGRAPDADPLIPAPDFKLALPKQRTRKGIGQAFRDLTSHPWAGTLVTMVLAARDDAGQEGLSETKEFILPARNFRHPLARAVVEQRRNLAVDRNAHPLVLRAIEALTVAPERHFSNLTAYLGLRSVYWRLRNDTSDETLLSVLDQMWKVALTLEDGDLSLAAEELRAAQERLMQALNEDASDEEIRQLMKELREAMYKFLQELARNAPSEEDMAELPFDPNMQELGQDQLQKMLDQIEEMARQGAKDAARQMLSQLQNMLENLRMGRMQPQDGQQGQMSQMLDELGEMIRRQQELMSDTFRFDRQNRNGNQQGQQPGQQQGQQGQLGQLGQSQGQLQQALRELLQRMQEMGVAPDGPLGDAGKNMGQARERLGEGETGEALDEQGQALDNLRRGAQSLAETMADAFAQDGRNQGRQRTDLFGRPTRTEGPDLGTTVKVPDEIDAERARRILEELRRRLSRPELPRFEFDYLERLLERY